MKIPNILIVDSTELSKTISDALKYNFNCNIKITNSCEKAVKTLKTNHFDILVQDDFCPEKVNGLAVVDFVLKEKKNVGIIFKFCGDSFFTNAIKNLDGGDEVIFLKPFGIVPLFKAVEDILDKKGGFDFKIKRSRQILDYKFKYTRSQIDDIMRPILTEAIKSPNSSIRKVIEKTMPWSEYQLMVKDMEKYFERGRMLFSKETAKRTKLLKK